MSKPQSPLVSVIIPCYNQGQYLHEALASVLQSTYSPIEIVLVDDGSTDAVTKKILKKIQNKRVKILRQDNLGVSTARNNGIRASHGKYFLPLDADDAIAPTYIEKAVSLLEQDSSLGFVYSYVQFFGDVHYLWETPQVTPSSIRLFNSVHSCSVIRREAYGQTQGYNPNMHAGYEDWDFCISLLEAGWSGSCIPEPLFYYRKYGKSRNDYAIQHHRQLYQQMRRNHPRFFRDFSYYLIYPFYRLYRSIKSFLPRRVTEKVKRSLAK